MAIPAGALMDQVDREEQLAVGEDLCRRSGADQAMVFAEDDAAIGQRIERVEIVSGQDDGLACTVQLDDQLDQPLLGPRIERDGDRHDGRRGTGRRSKARRNMSGL